MSHFIDSHAHIYLDQYSKDRDEVLRKTFDEGVNKIYMPNIDSTSIDDMMEVEEKYPDNCFAMMGLHPCSVKKGFEKELYLVEDWLKQRAFKAVGEIGTDLYWDKTLWEEQKEAFRIQVTWAKQFDLPIVIHCRESLDQTIELVEELKEDNLTGVFHCFTGTVEQAEKIEKLGFYIGIGGVATFKNGGMEAVLENVSLNQMLLETDSPYLTPAPHRGKRNSPEYIPLIAQRIADAKNITIDEVAKTTTNNAEVLFEKE